MARGQQVLPSQSDAASGAGLSLTNARRHLKAAETLRAARLYGPGVGHLVLAVEEVAKAWLLTLVAMGFEVPDDMLRGILRQHDARHATVFGDLFAISILHLAERAAKRVQRRHRVKGYPPELRDEWVEEMMADMKALPSRSPSTEPVLALFKWISNASARKNSGFYVDFTSRGWEHPGSTRVKQFDEDYVLARAFIRRRGDQMTKLLRNGFQADDQLKERARKSMAGLEGATPQQLITRVIELLLGPNKL